jgi:hypothetical protein
LFAPSRRNFSKLPMGVVCVADVQFKGRGAFCSSVKA